MKCLELKCRRAGKIGGLCYRHERRLQVYIRVAIPSQKLQRKRADTEANRERRAAYRLRTGK